MIKKIVAASIFIFWAAVTAILTAGLVYYQDSTKQPTGLAVLPGQNLTSLALTTQEIAKHDNPADCWLIINNKVYDVTSYLNFHPGNPETITPYCGNEATQAFATKDRGKPHSQEAANLLNQYYIGDVGQQARPQTTQPAPPPPSNRFEYEDD